MCVQIPADVCVRYQGGKWWGRCHLSAPSMFAYNSCIPSAYLERRNQSSAILRSPYAGLNDFE